MPRIGGRSVPTVQDTGSTTGTTGASGTDATSGGDVESTGIGASDGFESGGPSAYAGDSVVDPFSGGNPTLAAEARRRMLEAQLGGADADKGSKAGSFDWSRGPRGGAAREWGVDRKKQLVSTRKTVDGQQVLKKGAAGEAEGGGDGGRFKDWSASATVFSKGTGGHRTWKNVEGEADLGGGVKASGEAHLGKAWGVAMADAAVDLKSGTVTGTAQLTGEARLAGVEGKIEKTFGDDRNSVGLTGWGKAYVGASGTGKVDVRLNPKEGTAIVGAGVEAFAGAKAVGVIRPSVKIAGEEISTFSGVTGEAWAGVGATARAEAGIEKGRLKASFELGAALGVGGKVAVNVDVNLVGVKNLAGKGYQAAKDKAVEAGGAVRDAVSSGVADARTALSGAFASVKSWW